MVKVQRDDGGEGTRSYQVQQIEAASDWFLAPCEVIGVPTRLPSDLFLLPLPSSSLTFSVGPNTYRTCPSSPLPSLAKSFPPASALLIPRSLHHGSHPPRNLNFCLVAVYFISVLLLIYKSTCSPGLLLSLISPSLSSPQRKHLCSVSIIRLGSALVAYLLVTLTDGLSVVLSFTSYMLLGTPSNPLAPRWMMHHDVKAQTGL